MIQLSQETEALARRIAGTRGMRVDAVIQDALAALARADASSGVMGTRVLGTRVLGTRVQGTRDASPPAVARRHAAFTQLSETIAALPLLDGRLVQEIIDDINAV